MKEIGLWINRREAIIVIFEEDKEEIKNVFADDTHSFYEDVVSILRDADSIRIFGPDEAKLELVKHFEREGIDTYIVETPSKRTDSQGTERVQQDAYF